MFRFLDFDVIENFVVIVNNFDWIGKMNVIDFLCDVGKNFGINYMLVKDMVSLRIEFGILYMEFSYMIF